MRQAAWLVLQCERRRTDVRIMGHRMTRHRRWRSRYLTASAPRAPTFMQLDELFKQPQALPAVPKIVHELIDSFNNDDISIEEIAR